MKIIFFTVGPGQLYSGMKKFVGQAFEKDIPSISHRSAAFSDLFKDTKESLFRLLGIPGSYHMFLAGSGLEAMERTVLNISGNSSTHFVGGGFARKWSEFAHDSGKRVTRIVAEDGCGFDLGSVSLPSATESIFVTVNETSTGVYTDEKFVRALRARHPKALIAVDMVSAAPYVKLDYNSVDAAHFSVQKGFGLPAGLGVLIVSPRALRKSRKIADSGGYTGTYHSFISWEKMEAKYQTPETPNILSLYLLNRVLDAMHKKGIREIRNELKQRARMVYDFFDTHSEFAPFVIEKNARSPMTIIIQVPTDSSILIRKLSKKGFIVSSGYGLYKTSQIRIANYPAHSEKQFEKLMRALNA